MKFALESVARNHDWSKKLERLNGSFQKNQYNEMIFIQEHKCTQKKHGMIFVEKIIDIVQIAVSWHKAPFFLKYCFEL